MNYFLQTSERVRIIAGEQEFECPLERFAELEPEYPGLPDGAVCRYWTPGIQYFEGGVEYDGHDCQQYCDNLASYTQYPRLYARVTLSKTDICACDPNDAITFTASLEDADENILPIDYAWFVRLTHEVESDVDRILLDFVQGQCSKGYTCLTGLPLGVWYVDESKFDLVEFGGQRYEVRLVNPVRFTVYRELS